MGSPPSLPCRRRRHALTAAVAVAGALATATLLLLGGPSDRASAAPATPAAPAPAPPRVLAGLPAGTTQAVVVDAPSRRSTTATLTGWERRGGEWAPAIGPVPAHLGRAGLGPSTESSPRTPEGTFGMTRAFGRAPDPGTALPYDRVGPDDWWVSDTASPRYNTRQTCRRGTCPFDEAVSENLQGAGPIYDHAVVIDANTDPVRQGAGSAYFLHIGDEPTAGCVAVARSRVVALMRWLRPAAKPVISIGVRP